ncbi:DUF3017 domain-containing protein [Nocardioides sp. zg-578]|nr:DUF3017 domain-containing protein [Nocardioides marmotae]
MGDRRLGLAQPRRRGPDDPRDAADERRHHGRALPGCCEGRCEGHGLTGVSDRATPAPGEEPEPPEDGILEEPDPSVEPAPSEDEVAAVLAEEIEQLEERRYPSTIGGACYLLVLAVTTVGIGVVTVGEWRLGIRIVAGAILAAAALRLVLRRRDAGMLAVRHRLVDVLVLVVIGSALVFLSATIPDQPV